jgi:predicted phosphoadenosine phosphosulfate sulfurtransferase
MMQKLYQLLQEMTENTQELALNKIAWGLVYWTEEGVQWTVAHLTQSELEKNRTTRHAINHC